ncbi:MAG: ornithine cyclodeaminase family protein [Acidobacteria bacterium]|nr:ornithine cyclodeaminase family protein [Acidobacteriota bacterium]
MAKAIELVERGLLHLAAGEALNHPRRRAQLKSSATLHYMAAVDVASGYLGAKIYSTHPQTGAHFVVLLYASDGKPLASIEANALGQIRTGAASGVATRRMARADARIVGLIGSGFQAETQLEAVARGCDIAITATTARDPVLLGEWLGPGAHINAVGSNHARRQELDAAAVAKAGLVVADSVEQARMESGDLIAAFERDAGSWDRVVELADVVAGKHHGRRSDDEITLFKSNGLALEDIAVAGYLYEQATGKV